MTYHFLDQPTEANTFRAVRTTMDVLLAALETVRRSHRLSPMHKFDLVLLEKAFIVALEYYAQMDQSMRIREDGRLFIYHPLEVALYVVNQLQLTDPAVVAGILLHDTLEYTPMTVKHLQRSFGTVVTSIALDLSQDIDLKNEVVHLGDSDLVARVRSYLPKTFAIDTKIESHELPNVALKLEHYGRLLSSPAHKLSQLIKIADNLHAYSSIFHVDRSHRKRRTQSELRLFSQYVTETAAIHKPPTQLLRDVEVVLNAWKQEGEALKCPRN